MNYGSWKIDDNLTFTCNTHTPSTGAATDADAVPDYRVYEDETGTAILSDSMAKLDDANTTGFYSEQIALSAANGFEKGKTYNVYISAAVGGVTGSMCHTFQIEAEVDANTVSGSISTVGAVSGAVGSVAGNVGGSVASVVGAVGSVTGNVGGNVAGSVGSVTGAVASVTGAVGSVTGNVGGNVVGTVGSLATQAKADVNAECDTAVTALATSAALTTVEGKIDTISGYADILDDATNGLVAIKAEVEGLGGEAMRGTDNAALATALGTHDGKLDTVDSNVDLILADTGTDGVVLTSAAVDAILDEVVEGSLTFRQILRIVLANVAGTSTGGGTTTITFKDVADSKARITATIDEDQNRTAITLDGS